MIIDCISDLHGHYPELPGGDLLIIAGDLTAGDTQDELDIFDSWLSHQPYKKKIFIAGNHDNLLLEEKPRKYMHGNKNGWYERCEYLCDSGTEYEGLRIWGTPWTPYFEKVNPKCTAFMSYEYILEHKFELIPHDIDILITHGPPYGILDENIEGKHCGSKSLLEAIKIKKPKLVLYGHIHEFGLYYKTQHDILFVNASFVDEMYKPKNGFIKCHYQDSLFMPFLIPTHMKVEGRPLKVL